MTLPVRLLGRGFVADGAVRLEGRSEVWLVNHRGGEIVLRRNDPALLQPVSEATIPGDIGWVHRFLARLRESAVEVPRPVPVLGGSSVAVVDGAVWEALTFVPGRIVGWDAVPTMFEVGAFMARFHEAISGVEPEGQREGTVSVASLVESETWTGIQLSAPQQRVLSQSVGLLAEELDRVRHGHARHSVIHGDLTNHNVLASGVPPRPCGVIDFANAYSEATLADVGFALWRSGRRSQDADRFDFARIGSFIAGYHSRRPLDSVEARAVAAYLLARGLQIVVKQARRASVIDSGPLSKLEWLLTNAAALRDCLASASRS